MLGFEAEGLCFGMQVENLEPVEFVEGLTPKVKERMPFLAETVRVEAAVLLAKMASLLIS